MTELQVRRRADAVRKHLGPEELHRRYPSGASDSMLVRSSLMSPVLRPTMQGWEHNEDIDHDNQVMRQIL